jgi:hypothetical protein
MQPVSTRPPAMQPLSTRPPAPVLARPETSGRTLTFLIYLGMFLIALAAAAFVALRS